MNVERKIWIGLFIIAFFLGIYAIFCQLGRESMWTDEILSASHSKNSISEIIHYKPSPHRIARNAHPVLHYILMHFSFQFGESDFYARLPSALFGVSLILLMFIAGKEIFDLRTGVLAAFLMAISKMNFSYSNEARMYTHFAFFSLLSFLFLIKILYHEKEKKRWWFGFAFATVGNLYTHSFAVMVLGVELMTTFMILSVRMFKKEYRRSSLKKFCIGLFVFLGIAILVSPEFLKEHNMIFSHQGGERLAGGMKVEAPTFLRHMHLMGGRLYEIALVFFSAFLVGLVCLWRKRPGLGLLTSLWFVIPYMVMLSLSASHFFSNRYFIFMLPVYLLITAYGLMQIIQCLEKGIKIVLPLLKKIPFSLFFTLLVMTLFIWDIIPTFNNSMVHEKDNWKGAVRYLMKHAKPGEAVFTDRAADRHLRYYFDLFKFNNPIYHIKKHKEEIKELSPDEFWYVVLKSRPDDFLGEYKVIDHQRFGSLNVKSYKMRRVPWVAINHFELSETIYVPEEKITLKLSLQNPDPLISQVVAVRAVIGKDALSVEKAGVYKLYLLMPQERLDAELTLQAPKEEGSYHINLVVSDPPFAFNPFEHGYYFKVGEVGREFIAPHFFTLHSKQGDPYPAFMSWGPYRIHPHEFFPGGHYQAMFILRGSSQDKSNHEIALLDIVANDGQNILAEKIITHNMLTEGYQPYYVDFTLNEASSLEFRIQRVGNAELVSGGIYAIHQSKDWHPFREDRQKIVSQSIAVKVGLENKS